MASIRLRKCVVYMPHLVCFAMVVLFGSNAQASGEAAVVDRAHVHSRYPAKPRMSLNAKESVADPLVVRRDHPIMGILRQLGNSAWRPHELSRAVASARKLRSQYEQPQSQRTGTSSDHNSASLTLVKHLEHLLVRAESRAHLAWATVKEDVTNGGNASSRKRYTTNALRTLTVTEYLTLQSNRNVNQHVSALGSAAHSLRNHLTAIGGFLEIAKINPSASDDLKNALKRVGALFERASADSSLLMRYALPRTSMDSAQRMLKQTEGVDPITNGTYLSHANASPAPRGIVFEPGAHTTEGQVWLRLSGTYDGEKTSPVHERRGLNRLLRQATRGLSGRKSGVLDAITATPVHQETLKVLRDTTGMSMKENLQRIQALLGSLLDPHNTVSSGVSADNIRESLQVINRSAANGVFAIESTILQPNKAVAVAPVRLSPLKETINDILIRQRGGRKVETAVDIEQSLAQKMVLFDFHHIVDALRNLIKNAVESDSTKISVRIRSESPLLGEQSLTNKMLAVTVTDNGCGIAPDKLDGVMKRGFTHGKEKGTGIGLDDVRRVAEAHAGSFTIASDGPGKGTVATIRFPLIELSKEGRAVTSGLDHIAN